MNAPESATFFYVQFYVLSCMLSLTKYPWLLLLIAVGPLVYIAYTEPLFIYDEGYNYIAAYEWIEHQHYFVNFDAHSPL